jgi:hypothetical protein
VINAYHQEEWRGERQAKASAGPWPKAGTFEELRASADRAHRAAQLAHTLEYRWNQRFRLWEHHDDPIVELHTARLMARRYLAIDISEARDHLLRRLCEPPRGHA